VRNTIARGTLGDLGTRVGDEDGSCHLEIILDVDTTNYRTIARSPNAVNTIVLGPGNQTAPAQTDDAAIFTDARYRQKQTSPTVDAGIAGAQTGSTDPDGDPRSNGGRPDIGADEMLEASFATATLTPRSPTTADLVATGLIVVPPRLSYTSMVEVGTTTAYGREIQTIDGASSTGVWSRTVVDLPAGALLHYRVNSTVSNGTQSRTTPGPDMTLQMPAAPALPVPPTVPAPAPKPKPKLKLKAATVIKLGTPARRCSSRRVLTLGLTAPKGAKLVKAKVTLRDKTTTYSGKKLKAKIDLRGLPKRAFKLKVSVLLADGRTATLTKSYKSCSARPRARATASSAVAISPA
jgi:hypothetical protein